MTPSVSVGALCERWMVCLVQVSLVRNLFLYNYWHVEVLLVQSVAACLSK